MPPLQGGSRRFESCTAQIYLVLRFVRHTAGGRAPEVWRSNPAPPKFPSLDPRTGTWCSLVNTLPCQGRDHGFKSRRPRQSATSVFYIYILRSFSSGKCYIGSSDNLLRRYREHSLNQELATKNRGPWEMIHWEAFATLPEARRREKFLKSGFGYKWRKGKGLLKLG